MWKRPFAQGFQPLFRQVKTTKVTVRRKKPDADEADTARFESSRSFCTPGTALPDCQAVEAEAKAARLASKLREKAWPGGCCNGHRWQATHNVRLTQVAAQLQAGIGEASPSTGQSPSALATTSRFDTI